MDIFDGYNNQKHLIWSHVARDMEGTCIYSVYNKFLLSGLFMSIQLGSSSILRDINVAIYQILRNYWVISWGGML